MTKIERVREELSNVALRVLEGQGFEHPGYAVQIPPTMSPVLRRRVLAELFSAGVTGPSDGLTITGSGVVAVLRAAKFDALF